ncbi:hypothetical protein [Mucilaginibacter sp.]
MLYYKLLLIVLLNAKSIKPPTLQGTYKADYGKDAFKILQIYNDVRHHKTYFYMELNRGAPSYNSGAFYGEMAATAVKNHFTYIYKELGGGCKLSFVRSHNRIVVKTVEGSCPFGGNVYADALYDLISSKNPQWFIDRKGQKIRFNKTPPWKYIF